MLPPGFGWSAGDIAIAIEIIGHILKAFNHAKGAKKQYALSCGFLRQLVPVLKRIEVQIAQSQDEQLRSDLTEQCEAITAAYDSFDEFLSKRYHGLSAKEPSKARAILQTIRWALDELHEKVQKFRDKVNDALQPYKTLLLQEVCSKVEALQSNVGDSGGHQQRLLEIQAAMNEVTEQVRLHEELSKDYHEYQTSLAEDLGQQQRQDTAAIRGDLANMRAEIKADNELLLQTSKAESADSKETHLQLMQCQKTIVTVIESQQHQARNQDEMMEWLQLQDQAKRDAEASERGQKLIQGNIQATGEAFRVMSDVTKDKRLSNVANKMEGGTRIFGVLNKFGGLWGGGGDSSNDRPRPSFMSSKRSPTPAAAPSNDRPRPTFTPSNRVTTPTIAPPPNGIAAVREPSPKPAGSPRTLASPPPRLPRRRTPGKSLADPFGTGTSFPAGQQAPNAVTRPMSPKMEPQSPAKPQLPPRPATTSPTVTPAANERVITSPPLPATSPPKRPGKPAVLRSPSTSTAATFVSAQEANRMPQLSRSITVIPSVNTSAMPSGARSTPETQLRPAVTDSGYASSSVKEQAKRFEGSPAMGVKLLRV